MKAVLNAFASSFVLFCFSCGPTQSLNSDHWIFFECKAGPPSEAAIKTFLEDHGFFAVDGEHVRREYGMKFFPVEIESYDSGRRMIDFRGFEVPGQAGHPSSVFYSVSLDSPPPTRHDRQLEENLSSFVSQTLTCKISEEGGGENGPETKAFFDDLFSRQQSRIHETRICDRDASTYDQTACKNVPGVP